MFANCISSITKAQMRLNVFTRNGEGDLLADCTFSRIDAFSVCFVRRLVIVVGRPQLYVETVQHTLSMP